MKITNGIRLIIIFAICIYTIFSQNCQDTCEICNQAFCYKCKNGYFLDQVAGYCYDVCPRRTYGEQNMWKCRNCHQNCDSCFGEDIFHCLKCNDKFYLKGQTCYNQCFDLNQYQNRPIDQIQSQLNKSCNAKITKFSIQQIKINENLQFQIFFDQEILLPIALDISKIIEIQIIHYDNLNNQYYDITFYRINSNAFLISLNNKVTIFNPQFQITFGVKFYNYVRTIKNQNITLQPLIGVFEYQYIPHIYNFSLPFAMIKNVPQSQFDILNRWNVFIQMMMLIIVVLNFFGFCINSNRLQHFWSFSDNLQLLSIFNFLGVEIPYNLIKILNIIFKRINMTFFIWEGKQMASNNLFKYYNTIEEKHYRNINLNYYELLGTTSFVINGMNIFLILFSTFFLYLLLLVITQKERNIKKIQDRKVCEILQTKYVNPIYNNFNYLSIRNIFKRILTKFTLSHAYAVIIKLNFYFLVPFLFFALCQLIDFEWGKTSISRAGIIFALISFIYCFYFLYYLWDKVDDCKGQYNWNYYSEQYKVLIRGLKFKGFKAFYQLINQTRKVIIIVIYVVLNQNPLLAITSIFIVQLVYFIFLVTHMPFINIIQNIIILINDGILCIFFGICWGLILQYQNMKSQEKVNDEQSQKYHATSLTLVIIIIIKIILNLFIAIYIFAMTVKELKEFKPQDTKITLQSLKDELAGEVRNGNKHIDKNRIIYNLDKQQEQQSQLNKIIFQKY